MKFTKPLNARFIKMSRLELLATRHHGTMRILHMGCVDSGLLYQRIKSNELFHLQLIERFGQSLVYGVDSDGEGIGFLRKMGIGNLFVGDATSIDLRERFDIVFAGEILEHITNPGLFLDNIRHILVDDGKLIITTPNAHFYWSFLFHVFGYEAIHPDHNSIFSMTSLKSLLRKRSYDIVEVGFGGDRIDFSKATDSSLVKLGKLAIQCFDRVSFFAVRKMFPQLAPSLIIVAKALNNTLSR